MRLTCPNCGAQYEVDDSVIPDEGRDVQCSGCGQGWFQPGKAAQEASLQTPIAPPDNWEPEDPAAAPETGAAESPDAAPEDDLIGWEEGLEGLADTPADAPGTTAEATVAPPVEAAAETPASAASASPASDAIASAIADLMRDDSDSAAAAALDDYLEDSDYDGALAAAPQAGSTPRRAVDDTMLAILREEAEREAAQRRAEGGALEMQGDLGLEAATPPPARAPAAPAKAAPAAAAPAPASDSPATEAPDEQFTDLEAEEPEPTPRGRERLPDIEEINSTLTATSDRTPRLSTPMGRIEDPAKGGFGGGFLGVLILAALGLLAYLFAARLIGLIPALEAPLSAYVSAVDSARIALDQMLQTVIARFAEPGA